MMSANEISTFRKNAFAIIDGAKTVADAIVGLRDLIAVDHVIFHSSRLGASPSVEPYVRLTYSGSWIKRYVEMDYMSVDPVLREGFGRVTPFFWADLLVGDTAREMLIDAVSHGVGPLGLSIPVRGAQGHRSLFSLTYSGSVEDWMKLTQLRIRDLVEIAHHIHKRAIKDEIGQSESKLSNRELEVLFWTGEGKDAVDIAHILSISRFTVRDYLKSARYKLDCVTSTQAVNKAIRTGILSIK